MINQGLQGEGGDEGGYGTMGKWNLSALFFTFLMMGLTDDKDGPSSPYTVWLRNENWAK